MTASTKGHTTKPHPAVPGVAQTDKAINQHFRELMDRQKRHLRVGAGRQDRTDIALVGDVWELHGPAGCCTCCERRAG